MKCNQINKKFELIKDDYITYRGRKLYRIAALKDFVEEVKGEE